VTYEALVDDVRYGRFSQRAKRFAMLAVLNVRPEFSSEGSVPGMPRKKVPSACHRERNPSYRTPIPAEWSIVAQSVLPREVRRIPKAQIAMDDEYQKLRRNPPWDETPENSWPVVAAGARRR
jgi:hypothetical protein